MEIKWSNVAAAGLLLVALVLGIRYSGILIGTVGSMGRIGPQYAPQDRTFGLLVLGLILVGVVAVVRLLVDRGRKD